MNWLLTQNGSKLRFIFCFFVLRKLLTYISVIFCNFLLLFIEEKWLLIKIHKMEIENEKLTSMTIEEYDKEIMELDREMAEKKVK